jgi:hypothetical protein
MKDVVVDRLLSTEKGRCERVQFSTALFPGKCSTVGSGGKLYVKNGCRTKGQTQLFDERKKVKKAAKLRQIDESWTDSG